MLQTKQLEYYYNYEKNTIKNTVNKYMKTKDPELYKDIDAYIKDEDIIEKNIKNSFIIKFYCYIHEIAIPRCKNEQCNNFTIYQQGRFNDFCCIKCCNTSNHKNDKLKITWQNKSEEDHQIKIEKFKESYKNNFENFKDNIMKSKKIYNLDKWNNKEFIEEHFLDAKRQFKLFEFMDYFNCCQPKAHNKLIELNINYSKINKMYSIAKKEVVTYIDELITKYNKPYKIIENHRINQKEFDILIKEDDKIILGIEYDGLYWHSYRKDTHRPKSYYRSKHLEKTEIAIENGFQLLHIFENEWKHPDKSLIWKSMIKNKLNITDDKIYARNCSVRYVKSSDATEFVKNNHIQGKNNRGVIKIGLYHKDELVLIGTFGTPQFVNDYKKGSYEIIRLCSKLDTQVVGGASKLLAYFIKMYNPKQIISYANRRWSEGEVYKQLHFTLDGKIPPNSYYIDVNNYNKMYHRRKYQSHIVKNILKENYNENISSMDNAVQSLNVMVIWDSGNYKFTYNM